MSNENDRQNLESQSAEASSDNPVPPSRALDALADFYVQTALTKADRDQLWRKRGLTSQQCALAGYRTNHRANLEILQRLAVKYDKDLLVEAGLWVVGMDGQPKPNSQFYGFGLVRRGKNARGEDQEEWGWKDDGRCNPVIIPYFDAQGRLFHLRPHKGGIKGKPPHLYVVRNESAGDAKCHTALICEGELKARAAYQVLNLGASSNVAAMPGISMAKNATCMSELFAWLQAVSPSRVIIAYDREEKGDPRLPGFKANPRKRHDAQIWARYLANTLIKDGYDAAVAVLPASWQDPKSGKADFDSRLAARIAELKGTLEIESEIWPAVAPTLREEFWGVLNSAKQPKEFAGSGVFTEAEERFIQVGLARLYRKRALPCGGGAELEISRRLKHLAAGPLKTVAGVGFLGEKYRQVVGAYYVLHPLRDLDQTRIAALRAQATRDGNNELLWYCDIQAKGYPKAVSDFAMTCHHSLQKEDNTRDRIVSIENIRGEKSGLVALDSRALTAPRDFRFWLANRGNFTWKDGERVLQELEQDLFEEAAFSTVLEVTYFGEHEPSGNWFFDDVAYGHKGQEILPDEFGIFWMDNGCFQVAENGANGQSFRQPRPRLKPHLGLVYDGGYKLVEGKTDDPGAIQGLFQETAFRLKEILGGYEGYLAVGSFLAYAAAREIFRLYGGFPGLWTTGEKGQGKTTLVQMLMEFHGFQRMQSGIGLLRNSTAAGIQIAVEQFSNLPVWLEEYREAELHPDKRGIIHSAFNRELSSKFAEDGRVRKIRTAFVVAGESTTSDAATRSRYPHVQVTRSRRKGDHLAWFQEHRDLFCVFGRFLMRNRPMFVELCLQALTEWQELPELVGVEDRSRSVYGVPYAGFTAMAQMLNSHPKNDLEAFRKEMVSQCRAAMDEVQEQTDVSQFFADLVSAYTRAAFGTTAADLKQCFRAERRESLHPPDAPNQTQTPYVSFDLFMKPGPVLDVIRKDKRAQGQDMRLSQLDLRKQLATKKFWIVPKNRMHRKRFAGKNSEGCWGFNLDFLEWGYLPMKDEDWVAHLEKHGLPGTLTFSDEWADPRHGELFALAHKLTAKE